MVKLQAPVLYQAGAIYESLSGVVVVGVRVGVVVVVNNVYPLRLAPFLRD